VINIDPVYEDMRKAVAAHPFRPELEREVSAPIGRQSRGVR
jgi:hypothetical protein